MYVPSDSFGGISPERKASQALQSLFTFISAKIVLAQLEGSGRGALAAYNQEQYKALFKHLHDVPLTDAHAWLEQLMRQDKAVALRLMEVRDAYSKEDFEWDQLQRLSTEAIKKSNLQLMRQAATASLQATADTPSSSARAVAAPQAAAEEQQQETQRQQQQDQQQVEAHRGGIESSGTSGAHTEATAEEDSSNEGAARPGPTADSQADQQQQ